MTGTPDEAAMSAMANATIRVLWDVAHGGSEEARALLAEHCPEPADGFAWCCGVANLIAMIAVKNDPHDGPLIVELELHALPGVVLDPLKAAGASDTAAFIAAVGNKDYEGAFLIFDRSCCTAGGAGSMFIAELHRIGAAVLKHVVEEGEAASG